MMAKGSITPFSSTILTHDRGRYHAFSNRGVEVKLTSVSLFDCGPFLRPDRNSTSAARNRSQ